MDGLPQEGHDGKYGFGKVRSLKDYEKYSGLLFEKKLADLYFATEDKVQLEKDMAEIHPHKNWLLKTIKPIEEKSEVIEELKAPVIDRTKECACCPSCSMNNSKSNFYGDVDNETRKTSNRLTSYETLIGPVMILAIFSLAAITVVKASK